MKIINSEFYKYVLFNVDRNVKVPYGDGTDLFCYIWKNTFDREKNKRGFSICKIYQDDNKGTKDDYYVVFHKNNTSNWTGWPSQNFYYKIKPRATMIVAITLAQHGYKINGKDKW